ncbi:hypothetical protein DWV16_16225 [Anaerotruncus sp. AF02-27]|uniref:phage tail tube protein n=1 Tax=Anaerotruncus TaxID=244127 RepID=UPI000E4B5322|nr:hypothetical protein [Anaerotruncus sp. AF02-27]RGX53772.1 hypothetical protein DWV16_16225 [Anaerotruncus sp. AF02-27]
MALVMRHEFLAYMNTTPAGESPTYALMGDGFSEANEQLNPTQKDTHYIHQRSGTSSITGYAPTMAFVAERENADPVIQFICEIGELRKTGSDCVTDVILVDTWDTTAGKQKAYKQQVAIKADAVRGGNAGESLAVTGSLLYRGDAVEGEWDPATKAFTAKEGA